MMSGFVESWSLFHHAYLSGWLLAIALALVGVLVVARDQIFIGAAIAQASTLGIAMSLWLGMLLFRPGDHHGHGVDTAAAVMFSIGAAWAMFGAERHRHESGEGIAGWTFLFCSSAALLLVARSPMGLDEVQRLLASSLIGANVWDVVGFGLLAAIASAVVARHADRLILVAVDPAQAAAQGLRVRAWERGVAVAVGLVVGLGIHSAGLLYTFGFLVLPALIARRVCREIRPMFVVAPLTALAGSVAGFVLADSFDVPPAQAAVALMALGLAGCWCRRPGA